MRSKGTPTTPPPPPLVGPLLTLPEVAQHLALSLRAVQALRASGALPVVTFGRAVRVSPEALARFVAERSR